MKPRLEKLEQKYKQSAQIKVVPISQVVSELAASPLVAQAPQGTIQTAQLTQAIKTMQVSTAHVPQSTPVASMASWDELQSCTVNQQDWDAFVAPMLGEYHNDLADFMEISVPQKKAMYAQACRQFPNNKSDAECATARLIGAAVVAENRRWGEVFKYINELDESVFDSEKQFLL